MDPSPLTPQSYAELMQELNLVSQIIDRFPKQYTSSHQEKTNYSQRYVSIA